MGSVSDPNLAVWALKIGRVEDAAALGDGEDALRVSAERRNPVTEGVLGRFAPTFLTNGLWRVVLEGIDVNGASAQDEIVPWPRLTPGRERRESGASQP